MYKVSAECVRYMFISQKHVEDALQKLFFSFTCLKYVELLCVFVFLFFVVVFFLFFLLFFFKNSYFQL